MYTKQYNFFGVTNNVAFWVKSTEKCLKNPMYTKYFSKVGAKAGCEAMPAEYL